MLISLFVRFDGDPASQGYVKKKPLKILGVEKAEVLVTQFTESLALSMDKATPEMDRLAYERLSIKALMVSVCWVHLMIVLFAVFFSFFLGFGHHS